MNASRSFARPLVHMLVGLLALAAFGRPSATAAEPTTLEKVLAVWREREEATKSLWVVIDEQYFSRAHFDLEGRPIGGRGEKHNRLIAIDGIAFRHERNGELWPPGPDTPAYQTQISAFNGQLQKDLSYIGRDGRRSLDYGHIRHRDRHTDLGNGYLSPILMHYRPLSPKFIVFDLDKLAVVSEDERVNGIKCIVLEEKDEFRVNRRWVAPERDMGVVRFRSHFRGRLAAEADVTFKHDARLGWYPASWSAATYIRDSVHSSGTQTVEKIELNLDLPASVFDVEFPPGTEVYDHTTRRKFVAK